MQSIFQNRLDQEVTKTFYQFPQKPFENIGFALSGGGFRAATYGLGVLSLLHHIKWEEDNAETTLLEKVRFVSSASGGTITLGVYTACLHHRISFLQFYHHLNRQMTGETLFEKAIANLKDPTCWPGDKSRNIINAFAIAYHDTLFSILPNDRTLGDILEKDSKQGACTHIEEFCFNSTDFYTGICFRFQGSNSGKITHNGLFGNHNIRWLDDEHALSTLGQIRLGDVLAASSCFPMGFEPMIFPRDFSYNGGPSLCDLKDSITLETLSWDDKKTEEENMKNYRAKKEKEFAKQKEFGLMDGGISDNQGLHSLILANSHGNENGTEKEFYHRFDLMMVNDVTSFYMSPYKVCRIKTDKKWMEKTPQDYWTSVKNLYKVVNNWVERSVWISMGLAILFALPVVFERISVSGIVLALIGVLIVLVSQVFKMKYDKIFRGNTTIKNILSQNSPEDLVKLMVPKESFTRRSAIKVVNYFQSVQTGIIFQMIYDRLQSSAVMIGDIFLKHIRRLIYDELFNNSRFVYRRLDNVIYKLTYTNNKNRRHPAFEPKEAESEENYVIRKESFLKDVEQRCRLSAGMQKTAECAYGTGTAMWFAKEQEHSAENNRKALIATGQFTTCYNLLEYSLSLKHSRHFVTLNQKYQDRTEKIIQQLTELMKKFEDDSYYLYNLMESEITN